jgi:hypothetical protein
MLRWVCMTRSIAIAPAFPLIPSEHGAKRRAQSKDARFATLAILASACLAAGCSSATREPARPRFEVKHLSAHAGATALWGNARLIAGMTQDWEKPGPINLSRGAGAIERTIDAGWMIDVVGERAYLMRPATAPGTGSEVEIVRVGLTGDPEVLATVPRDDPTRVPTAAVTGTETVAIIVRTLDPATAGDGSVLDRHASDLMLIDASGSRRMPLAEPAEHASIVANPHGPELLAIASYNAGTRPGRSDSWIALIDTRTAAVRWTQDLVPRFHAADGELAFTDKDIVLHHGNDVVRIDLATGARTVQWKDIHIKARNLELDTTGTRVAFTVDVGSGHGSWADPACQIYVVDGSDPARRTPELLERSDGGCYFGQGLRWVDGALWIAPAR